MYTGFLPIDLIQSSISDIYMYPSMTHALDPILHTKDRLGPGGNNGTRLLIDAIKPILKPRAPEYRGERFATVALPDDEIMEKVRKPVRMVRLLKALNCC